MATRAIRSSIFVELPVKIILVQPAFRRDRHMDHLCSFSLWQIVRMVLHHGDDHNRIVRNGYAVREFVDGLGRILSKNHAVRAQIGAYELRDRCVGSLVDFRTQPRFETGATMNA